MNNDASLKEYYIKLQNMYNKAVSMLSAIDKALTSSASEIELNISDTDDSTSVVRIPSFIYLENRLEDLESRINTLINMPEDGDAWLLNDGTTYKLDLIRSDIAPITPSIINNEKLSAHTTNNNVLRDFVLPKTQIKFELNNLPSNISDIFFKKIIINNPDLFANIQKQSNNGAIKYSDCNALLYNMKKGVDYYEYDSTIKIPVSSDKYDSEFKILEVLNSGVTEISPSTGRVTYKIRVNTMQYKDDDNPALVYNLKRGDLLALTNSICIYKVIGIEQNNVIIISEHKGRAALTSFNSNTSMVLKINNTADSIYKYINIPLEENPNIIIFISSVYNNVRSALSDGIILDLNNILMTDEYGNPILNSFGNQYSYIDYYNEYCNNVGDLILGMSKSAYPQITNYSFTTLQKLVESPEVKDLVSGTISGDNVLKVSVINKHLTDDLTNEELKNLHSQKNEINSKLQTCQSNIDQVYSTMLTTDFSQNVTITQAALQEKIQQYYSERTTLHKQLNAVIDNINSKSDNSVNSKTKYRVRGIPNTKLLEKYIQKFNNVNIIGIEIEYRYKSTDKDTASLTTINGSVFTDWNRQISIDKNRHLVFGNNGYGIVYDNYSDISNTIKWNQIDIPIQYGEDVSIRIRYKYSIGQPFINLYTPWSEEQVIVFPSQFVENVEIQTIVKDNEKDSIQAAFNKTLIDEGYTEHIQNKVLSNQRVFYHMPENIYSGFNTSENNLISLKDKLTQMSIDLDKYKEYIDGLSNNAFDVYLNYDDNTVLLASNSLNKINVYNTEHITDMFIKKEMNIVIKNTGNSPLKLYSLFPGNDSEHLITMSDEWYTTNKANYERVPIFIDNKVDGQYMNQWIYFRQNNPYTGADIYFNDLKQNSFDFVKIHNTADAHGKRFIDFQYNFLEYLGKNNSQCLLAFRNNRYVSGFNYTLLNPTDPSSDKNIVDYINQNIGVNANTEVGGKITSIFNTYLYKNYLDNLESISNANNQYVLRYEDFVIKTSHNKCKYLDNKTSLSDICKQINYADNDFQNIDGHGKTQTVTKVGELAGAFLFPNLLSKQQVLTSGGADGFKSVPVGGSISIPVTFEYFVESSENNSISQITKSLFFDIRNSLISEPLHYMLEITGNYDYTTSGDVYKNIDNTELMASGKL